MRRDWVAMEHYRLDCVLRWPDSPYKKAVLEAIRATLESLCAASPGNSDLKARGSHI